MAAQPKPAQLQVENAYYVPKPWKELYGAKKQLRGQKPQGKGKHAPEITGRPLLTQQLQHFDMQQTNRAENYGRAVRQRAYALHGERKQRIWEEYERLSNAYPAGDERLVEGKDRLRRMLEQSEADAAGQHYVWTEGADKFNEVQTNLHGLLGARHILEGKRKGNGEAEAAPAPPVLAAARVAAAARSRARAGEG